MATGITAVMQCCRIQQASTVSRQQCAHFAVYLVHTILHYWQTAEVTLTIAIARQELTHDTHITAFDTGLSFYAEHFNATYLN